MVTSSDNDGFKHFLPPGSGSLPLEVSDCDCFDRCFSAAVSLHARLLLLNLMLFLPATAICLLTSATSLLDAARVTAASRQNAGSGRIKFLDHSTFRRSPKDLAVKR